MKTREASNRLLEMVEEGLINRDTVIMACVKYMSEDDVADMCHINEFFYDEDEPKDEESGPRSRVASMPFVASVLAWWPRARQ